MINILCALHCEAKPVIEHYKLSAMSNGVFPVYSNKQINLVVTGIGKIDVAAAMGYLFVKTNEKKNNVWLNYGIAGHRNADIGSWFNVNKVTEQSTHKNWYPTRFKNMNCLTASLVTVDEPTSQYGSELLYDMEASSFMATALKFSSIELIQLMKIVSDNEENHLCEINKQQVKNLLNDNITSLIHMIEILSEKKLEYDFIYGEDNLFLACLGKWHFTQYQKKEVQRLIQCWRLLVNNSETIQFEEFKDAKQLIGWLKAELDDVSVVF